MKNNTSNPSTEYFSSNKSANNSSSVFSSNKTPFAVIEAYKNIRTNLIAKMEKCEAKTVAFTSANVAAGKSTTAINLAIAISKLNKKVLLLDADIHKPTIAKKLKLNNDNGFVKVIIGASDFENAVKKYNPYLEILTSGPIPSGPIEIFSSAAYDEFISNMKEKYDYILIDTPPVNIISDSLIIAQKSDSVVLIARPKITTHKDFKGAYDVINELNINILGTIINGDEINSEKYKSNKYRY